MPFNPSDHPPLRLTTAEPVARALRARHALEQRSAGRHAWEVPAVESLRSWCRNQWLQTWPGAQLLHDVQELMLWQQAIDEDDVAHNVLSKSALAREARATGRLGIEYRIDPENCPQYSDEHECFVRWHRHVRKLQRQHGWVTEAEIPALVAEQIRHGEIAVPRQLNISGGSSRLTPLEQHLLASLTDAGTEVGIEARPESRATITASKHADDDQQFRALALMLREKLLPCINSDRPTPTLLVLCDDPASRRELIESSFRPILAPWLLLPAEGSRPVPWRFSIGRSLDSYPLVAAAMAVCGFSEYENTLDEVSRLLLASALWTPAQREANARADFELRDEGGTRFTLLTLLSKLPATIRPRFDTLRGEIQAMPRRALPSAWVAHFERRLDILGWPGERPLHSAAFQARESWGLALNSFSAMDAQSGSIAHAQAITWLREIVGKQGFEPRADHEQPIQVMSLQEAAGMPADAVYLVDATDDVLPASPHPYPLLAKEALVAAGVPGVTAALALDHARTLADDLLSQTHTLHLSYAAVDERGAERTPTTLFGADIKWIDTVSQTQPTSVERAAAQTPLQWPVNDPVPPVTDAEAQGISGGVRIFKDFVEAPFFAFCKHRLGISELPEAVAGIPAHAQGNIIHAVLEDAWAVLRTRETLLAQTGEQLGQIIDAPLDRALSKHLPQDRYGRMLRQIERARLRDVILQWLTHEKRRVEPFEVIEREHRLELTFEGLLLRLVIDRIDRVSTPIGDRLLIIDYKTGREAEVRGWKTDKLVEPQLPLYASAAVSQLATGQIDGIAFAHIKDGHPALAAATNWGMGLIDRKRTFKIDSWPEQLDDWRNALSLIARGFLAGDAGIDDPSRHRYSFNSALLDLVREQP